MSDDFANHMAVQTSAEPRRAAAAVACGYPSSARHAEIGQAAIIVMMLVLSGSVASCGNPTNCGSALLGGYEQLHPYGGAPLHDTVWKAFRIRAVRSGEVNCFKVFVKGLIGDRSQDEVGVRSMKMQAIQ